MTAEYSYFRAEGRALDAIATVIGARAELAALRQRLGAKFGAEDVVGGLDAETGRYRVTALAFRGAEKFPAGWEQQGAVLRGRALGLPPADSPESFALAAIGGLMERAARRARLEDTLGCGEMPARIFPAGIMSGAFVRYRSFDDGIAPRPGLLPDTQSFALAAKAEGRLIADPLDFMQLNGAWYIRVPNDGGAPRFTPPDAVAVPYDRMIAADRAEWNLRHGIGGCNYPGIH